MCAPVLRALGCAHRLLLCWHVLPCAVHMDCAHGLLLCCHVLRHVLDPVLRTWEAGQPMDLHVLCCACAVNVLCMCCARAVLCI